MLNIFKRRKKPAAPEPEKLPREREIALVLNKLLELSREPEEGDFAKLKEVLNERESWRVFNLCGSRDRFPHSVILGNHHRDDQKISHLLNEITGLEVLPSELTGKVYESFLWSSYGNDILMGEDNQFMILSEHDDGNVERNADCLDITSSREFLLGRLFLDNLAINASPLTITYGKLCFNPGPFNERGYSLYRSLFLINDREIFCFYALKGQGPVLNVMAREIIKRQKESLGAFLSRDVTIKSAGSLSPDEQVEQEGYTLEGTIFTTGGPFPYKFLFPRKLINMFPQQECSTVKGKILQINRDLFQKGFGDFHKSHERFLFDDLISLLPERDLNLICQNFFVSRSMTGHSIRQLFYYKVKMEEKSKVLMIPFTSKEALVSHLPARLREEFISSRQYADSLTELLKLNSELLEDIYSKMNEGNLLLSDNGRYLLERETGRQLKESRMLRLKKLISDKRFLNALSRLDGKKVQVLLSGMNHTSMADTFVYQTEQLPLIKPFLSRNRFSELMEDIRFTQKKIKNGQIDINRVCDSVERFNREVRLFIDKEREENSRPS